jgi:hypothetical protein
VEQNNSSLAPLISIWPDEDSAAFMVMDGASINDLLDKLYDDAGPEFECLFAGDLEPDIAEVAPYLARLEPESSFSKWALTGWGEHWGIYAVVPAGMELPEIRRHFRKLNMVYGPDASPLFFRYYDPRVLRIILPTCDTGQLEEIFGPVKRFVLEGETKEQGLAFSLANGELVQERINLKV